MVFRILKRKKEAIVGTLLSILLIMMVSMYVVFITHSCTCEYTSSYIGSGLNASVLAGQVIDLNYLAFTNVVTVSEETTGATLDSYKYFKDALITNLKLDDTMISHDANVVNADNSEGGRVTIEAYDIYNVDASNNVTLIKCDPSTGAVVSKSVIGTTDTVVVNMAYGQPSTIKASGIYARISFNMKGLFNTNSKITKEIFIDITKL